MDIGAFEMCREAKLPILVFNYKQEGAIEQAVAGQPIGTIVAGDRRVATVDGDGSTPVSSRLRYALAINPTTIHCP